VPPRPSQPGRTAAIRAAIEAALTKAELGPETIGAVVSHAMGHPRFDQDEADAIAATLGEQPAVFAPIGGVGHTGAAAAAIGLGVATMVLENRLVPPTVNAERRDPECRVRLLTEAEELRQPYALVISHSHLGHAAVAILAAE
jgi:3-oxoacyl-(acyl-carrier-protein) synthase